MTMPADDQSRLRKTRMSADDPKKLSKLDARIPKWDMDNMVERPCPVCSNSNGGLLCVRPDLLQLWICQECGTYFVSPSPSNEQLNVFYSTYHDGHSRMPRYSPQLLMQTYDRFEPLGDVRVRKLHSLLGIRGSKILDVGFGQPFLLYLMKKLGARTYGIDLDPKAIEYAAYMKIDSIHKGDISGYNPGVEFDVIIMTDFVEHPLWPMQYIDRALSLLRKGGFILIWTPNGNGTIEEDEPSTFRTDLEHMQYFTNRTITWIGRKKNLEIMHLETLGEPYLDGIDKEPDDQNTATKTSFSADVKRSIKTFVRRKILREDLGRILVPIDAGKYHLFAILKKS